MEVVFKYTLKTIVETPLGTKAVVTTLGYDGKNRYFCQGEHDSQWWDEEDLKPV